MVPFGHGVEMLQVTHSLRIIVVLIFQDGQVIIIDLADLLRRRQGSRPGCFLQHPREVLQRPGGSAAGLTEHVNRSLGLETQGDQVLRFQAQLFALGKIKTGAALTSAMSISETPETP